MIGQRELRAVESYLRAARLNVERQVMLEAKIIDVQLRDGMQTGINWAAFISGNNHAGSFSLHNFQIVDGKVYIAMGHGGVWVVDISTPEKQSNPVPLGSYYPHEPRRDGESYSIYPWDVVVHDGYMLTAEGNTGLYVLHFAADPAGDETYDSFA